MKKTEVVICDDCNQRIATNNCDFCGNDLCENCLNKLGVNFAHFPVDFLYVCRSCNNKIGIVLRSKEFQNDIKSKIKSFLRDAMKKTLILKELKNEDNI